MSIPTTAFYRQRLKLEACAPLPIRAIVRAPLWGKMPGGHCRGRGGAEGG